MPLFRVFHHQQQQQERHGCSRVMRPRRISLRFCVFSVLVCLLWILPCCLLCTAAAAAAAASTTTSSSESPLPPPIQEEENDDDSSSSLLLLTTADGRLYFLDAWTGKFQSSCRSGAPLVTRSVPTTPPQSSSPNDEQNADSTASMIVIPGLDGKLYWQRPFDPSDVDDDDDDDDDDPPVPLFDTELSIPHLLEHPVRSCSSDGTNCGILSAVAHTTLFGIDTQTGSLLWSSTHSTSDRPSDRDYHGGGDDDHDRTTASSTVVLQRKDYWIRHISTTTGKQLWNVTLGTYHALDFDPTPQEQQENGVVEHDDDDDDDRFDEAGLMLPNSRRRIDRKETLSVPPLGQKRQRHSIHGRKEGKKRKLPALVFSNGGRQLAAVDSHSLFGGGGSSSSSSSSSSTEEGGPYQDVLWRVQAPHIVTSVFGIQHGRWKALTVLDEDDIILPPLPGTVSSSATLQNFVMRQLPSEPYNPQQQQDDQQQDYASLWMRQEAAHQKQAQWTQEMVRFNNQHNNNMKEPYPYQRLLPGGSPSTPSSSSASYSQRASICVETTDSDGEYSYQCRSTSHEQDQPLFLLPPPLPPASRSASVTAHAEGLLLSWNMVGMVVIGLLVFAVAARIWYKERKQSWLIKAALARIDSFSQRSDPGTTTRSGSDSSTRRRRNSMAMVQGSDSITGGGQLVLHRSLSAPDTCSLGGTTTPSKPHLRSQSSGTGADDIMYRLRAMEDDDDDDDDDLVVQSSPGAVPNTPNTSSEEGRPVLSAAATAASSTSTALVVASPPPLPVVQSAGGIPLVRYSRYASEFREIKALGKGGFGSVFSCSNKIDGREYAIKKVIIRGVTTDATFQQRLQRVLREVKILAVLDHPSIVRYYTAWLELQENDSSGANDDSTTNQSSSLISATTATTSPTKLNKNNAPRYFSTDDLTTKGAEGDTETEGRRTPQRQQQPNYNSPNPLGFQRNFDDFDDEEDFTNDADFDDDSDSWSYHQHNRAPVFHTNILSGDLGVVFEDSTVGGDDNNHQVGNHEGAATLPRIDERSNIQPSSSDHLSAATNNTSASVATPEQSNRSSAAVAVAAAMMSQRSTSTRGNGGERNATTTSAAASTSSPVAPNVKHTLYIQMQLCSGHTISEYLSNPVARRGSMRSIGQVDISAALQLFLQVAQAVEHVHKKGLIHRDLKPSNCFIDSGSIKVGDFGLSRGSNDRNESLTLTTSTDTTNTSSTISSSKSGDEDDDDHTAGIGTRLYASPEQTKGSNYDASTDVYSLGIMLFELCYPMYTGMERNMCICALRDKGVFPSTWDKTVGHAFPTIRGLIQSMLSTTPSARPTATAVAEHIQEVLGVLTMISSDNYDDAHELIFLHVEVDPAQDDVLKLTENQIHLAAEPGNVHILGFGMGEATKKDRKRRQDIGSSGSGDESDNGPIKIIEFAVRSTTVEGHDLVAKLRQQPGIRLARQVSTSSTASAATTAALMASSQSGSNISY